MPRMSNGDDAAASSSVVTSNSVPPPVSSSPTISFDRCAQCNASGVPLLAPDEPVGQVAPISPAAHNKPRYCNSCMIGKKVRVFWPVDESWYTGIVHEYDPSTGEHLLRYEDGDSEWVRIGAGSDGGGAPNTISPGESASSSKPPNAQPVQPTAPQQPHPPPPPQQPPQQQPSPDPGAYPPVVEDVARQQPSQAGVYYAPPGRMGAQPPPYHGSPPVMYYHPSGPGGHPMPPSYHHGQESHISGRGVGPGGELLSPSPADLHDTAASPTGGRSGKKGPKAWSKHEDATLLKIVQSMSMPMRWSVVAQSLPDRTGKQCRERYVNHLNPRLKTSDWNPVEDATVFHLYNTIGSHWSTMSKVIPGRTDNGIKNRFHNLRRQLEREDGHRLRLSSENDFPEQIRLDRTRKFPKQLQGKADELWDIESGIGVLSAQSVLGNPTGGSNTAAKTYFGPFRYPQNPDEAQCVRCGYFIPSVQTGREVCEKTGWCIACTRIPPHLSGNLLRECLNLRRCTDSKDQRRMIESWNDPPKQVLKSSSTANTKDESKGRNENLPVELE